jgi:hypothetical protein
MPKISITISEYNYWKLNGEGEAVSTVIQKALQHYWKTKKKRKDF